MVLLHVHVLSNGVGFPHHGEKIVAKKARRNSGEDTNMEDFTPDEKDVVCKRAFLAEKILHGNPSGRYWHEEIAAGACRNFGWKCQCRQMK